jgi:hypothetical protein
VVAVTRDELIALLKEHRDNDVRVATYAENGDADLINVTGVSYDEIVDCITIETEEVVSPLVSIVPTADGFAVLIEDEVLGTHREGTDALSLFVALVKALGGVVTR